MRVVTRSVSVLIVSAVTACSTEPGCDICTSSAIVYGTVTTNTGTPVGGARVDVEAFRETCGVGAAYRETSLPRVTAVDGSYRDRPFAGASPFRACVRVTVTPPSGSGLSLRTVEGAEVRFLEDHRARDRDSVRVDVTLSP